MKASADIMLHIIYLFVFFNLLKLLLTFNFQQKIIELKLKEYKEVAEHVHSEMEKLV